MVAAGCARKLVFSWLGNPGVGSLHAIRRAIEGGSLEIEEYSHFGMVGRYVAGAAHLPFYPLRSYAGSDLPAANPLIQWVASPYAPGDEVAVVPPLNPDVTIIHAQRADAEGNVQVWGLVGVQREAALAAERVIVVVEELVDADVVRSDPDRTLLPGVAVTAVCVEPYGAHPSFAQGYYDRDNAFYRDWDAISRDPARLDAWLEEWVRNVPDRAGYLAKMDHETLDAPEARPPAVRLGRLRRVPVSTPDELMIAAAAAELVGVKTVFVGIGLPNAAANLARQTVAPDLELIYESGVIGSRPSRLPDSIGDPALVSGATATMSMHDLFAYFLQGGRIEVGMLGAAQIDRWGNLNTTVIGPYAHPEVRLPGSGWRLRDRAERRAGGHRHEPIPAFLRRAGRLRDLARPPAPGRHPAPAWASAGPTSVITQLGGLPIRDRWRDGALRPPRRSHRGPGGCRFWLADSPRNAVTGWALSLVRIGVCAVVLVLRRLHDPFERGHSEQHAGLRPRSGGGHRLRERRRPLFSRRAEIDLTGLWTIPDFPDLPRGTSARSGTASSWSSAISRARWTRLLRPDLRWTHPDRPPDHRALRGLHSPCRSGHRRGGGSPATGVPHPRRRPERGPAPAMPSQPCARILRGADDPLRS